MAFSSLVLQELGPRGAKCFASLTTSDSFPNEFIWRWLMESLQIVYEGRMPALIPFRDVAVITNDFPCNPSSESVTDHKVLTWDSLASSRMKEIITRCARAISLDLLKYWFCYSILKWSLGNVWPGRWKINVTKTDIAAETVIYASVLWNNPPNEVRRATEACGARSSPRYAAPIYHAKTRRITQIEFWHLWKINNSFMERFIKHTVQT